MEKIRLQTCVPINLFFKCLQVLVFKISCFVHNLHYFSAYLPHYMISRAIKLILLLCSEIQKVHCNLSFIVWMSELVSFKLFWHHPPPGTPRDCTFFRPARPSDITLNFWGRPDPRDITGKSDLIFCQNFNITFIILIILIFL